MKALRFRIKSDIFPNWVYSADHYKMSYFFDRWEGQYVNEDNLHFNPVMEHYIDNRWVDVIPVNTL